MKAEAGADGAGGVAAEDATDGGACDDDWRGEDDWDGQYGRDGGGDDGYHHSRCASWVKLWDRQSERTVLVLNVHAQPFQTDADAKLRSQAIDRLVALIQRLNPGGKLPYVVTGDFNARSDETRPVYNAHLVKLGQAGLVDSFAVAAEDASDVPHAASLNQMRCYVNGKRVARCVKRFNSSRHYDYVWVPKSATVSSWATISGPNVVWKTVDGKKLPFWTGVIPSDHSPVVAKVTLP
ncbi:MAG: hypothetical protein LBR32_10105 [Propionibacteriaceae bacterium]|nr:hypothetical protein [Propionibacteriaceae bacterium]